MKLLICTFARADGSTYDASVSLNDATAANPEQVGRRREQLVGLHPGTTLNGWKLVDPTGKENTKVSIGTEEPPVIANPAGVQHPDATGNVQEQFNQPEPEPTPGEQAAELFEEADEAGLGGEEGHAGQTGEQPYVRTSPVEGDAAGGDDPFAEMVEEPKPKARKK